MVKLWWAPGSVAGAAVIALNECGVHWEGVRLDMRAGEQRSEGYLSINPKGRVPALSTPEGILTETGAILEYLAAVYRPALVPADPLQAARMREVMYYLASTMHVAHAHKARGSRWADREESFADMRAKVPETMTACTGYLEERIAGPLLFGEAITLADAYFYTVSNWLAGDGVDLAGFPGVVAFREAMAERRSVQMAREMGAFG